MNLLTRAGISLSGLVMFACAVYSEDLLEQSPRGGSGGRAGARGTSEPGGSSSVKSPSGGGAGSSSMGGALPSVGGAQVGDSGSGAAASNDSGAGGVMSSGGQAGAFAGGTGGVIENVGGGGATGNAGMAGSGGSTLTDPLLTVWNFENATNPFKALLGTAKFEPRGAGTAELPLGLQRGTAKSFGLPALPGGDAAAIYIPRLAQDEALLVELATPANGVYAEYGYTSDYTLIWDALWPLPSDGKWRALYQTSLDNADDAELFVANQTYAGLGAVDFHGQVVAQTWQRLVLVVKAEGSSTTLSKYIDGLFVGEEHFSGAVVLDWAIKASFLLFADDNRETAAVYLSGFAFAARAYTPAQVAALKGPSAAGPHVAGK